MLPRPQIMCPASPKAHIRFNTSKPHIKLWMIVFPDLLESPAHYARSPTVLDLNNPATAAGMGTGSWVHAFRNVVHLHMPTRGSDDHLIYTWCSIPD